MMPEPTTVASRNAVPNHSQNARCDSAGIRSALQIVLALHFPVVAAGSPGALPNFFFFVTTAYNILRHRGVPLGKRDFLGPVSWV
jgi:hypothetical protein